MNGLWEKAQRAWRDAQTKSRFGSHVVLTAAANVLLALLGLITGVLAARLLGPSGRGELAAIQMWPSVIATIAMLGLPEALVYFSARDPEGAGRYLGSAVTLALVSSVPFAAVGFFLMPTLLSAQPAGVVAAAQWYLLLVPLFALVGLPYHPLRGRQDFVGWNALRLLPSLGWLVVLVLAWAVGRAEPRWLAAAYLVMLAVLSVPLVSAVRSRVPRPYRPQVKDWGALLQFGLPSFASTLPQILNYRLDQMAMAAFLPSSALGLYVVAVAWGNISMPLLSAIGSATFPQVAGEGEGVERVQVLSRTVRMTVLVSLAAVALLLVATPWGLPWIFGEKFQEAVGAASILVIAGGVLGLNHVLEEGLRGLGRPTAVLWAESAGLAITAPFLWLLLPRLGLIGAAFASLLGYTAVCIVSVAWTIRLTGVSFRALLIPDRTDVRAAGSWTHRALRIDLR
ncbi:MAG TPA: oligosaccharide flippase family protein [Gemmatimonadales bacterium]|nr:oligosaccharide flippase family protein [Gemmatimonadales bacterium]